jgi:hypothetical protein
LATRNEAALDAVAGNALRAHAWASWDTLENRVMQLTRRAISSWRDLAGLDNQRDANSTSVDSARQLMEVLAYTA